LRTPFLTEDRSLTNLADLTFLGHDLHRPECVLTAADGTLHVADWRGGVSTIAGDGTITTVLAKGPFRPKPNGIAILADGGWLITHLGDREGGVFRLYPDGTLTPYLTQLGGEELPPTNYVHVDGRGRVWITVSTRMRPRILACRPDRADGFVVLVDETGARIVADGLGFTNECVVHPETGQLFVNETFGRRLTRFDVAPDGTLHSKTTIAEFGYGEFPDGLTFDADRGVWITSIVSNRIVRVAASGDREIILEDSDPDHVDRVEDAYLAASLTRDHLDRIVSKQLRNISSLAFGGADLRTVYLGCLLGDRIATFRTPRQGLRPAHWDPVMPKGMAQ